MFNFPSPVNHSASVLSDASCEGKLRRYRHLQKKRKQKKQQQKSGNILGKKKGKIQDPILSLPGMLLR